ncbi:hypothetical protein ACIP88_29275 [Streptomyces uncialis]|uniref:hypothetical protein n=1 Tax=Streptomyces uncialis TaxID=1048205 RepID=UPI0037F59701
MDRWDRVGRFAASGAALALTPYSLIKVSWVVGSLLGLLPVGAGFGKAGWVVLNSATSGWKLPFTPYLALARPADASLRRTSRSRRSRTSRWW